MILALLLACETAPPEPEVPAITAEEAAIAAAQVFCRAAGAGCAAEGAVARLAGHEVAFSATPSHFKALPGRTIGMGTAKQDIPGEVQTELAFTIALDGRSLVGGQVSHAASDPDLGAARSKALDEAAQRFVLGHGLGLADALAGQGQAPALAALGLEVGAVAVGETGWQGFAGYPVLRGRGFDPNLATRLAPQVRSVAGGIGPFLDGADPGQLHVVKLSAKLGGSGPPGPCGIVPPVVMGDGQTVSIVPLSGTVTVDGAAVPDGDKPAICALSEAVAWPLPQGGAELEWTQVVVVSPAQGG